MDFEKYWQERFSKQAKEIREEYRAACWSECGFSRRLNKVKEILSKWNLKECLILDAGCGPGSYLFNLSKDYTCTKFIGIDYSFEMLKRSQRYGKNFALISANVLNIPLKDSSVDIYLSIGVLQYVRNYEQVIKEAYRVLKPGGKLILNALNQKFFKKHKEEISYNPFIIKKKLEHIGFSIIDLRPFILAPKYLRFLEVLEDLKYLRRSFWKIAHSLMIVGIK